MCVVLIDMLIIILLTIAESVSMGDLTLPAKRCRCETATRQMAGLGLPVFLGPVWRRLSLLVSE